MSSVEYAGNGTYVKTFKSDYDHEMPHLLDQMPHSNKGSFENLYFDKLLMK